MGEPTPAGSLCSSSTATPPTATVSKTYSNKHPGKRSGGFEQRYDAEVIYRTLPRLRPGRPQGGTELVAGGTGIPAEDLQPHAEA
ncbi:hypothetical protein GCM10009731_50410 [Streptomyces globosus]